MEQIYRFAVRTRNLALPLRYAVTTCFVMIAAALRWWVFGPQPGYPFIFFYPAVILSGAILDRGTGMFTTALSAAVGIYYFIKPTHAFVMSDGRDVAAVVVFLATAGFIALLLEGGHLTFNRMTRSQEALERANTQLSAANAELAQAQQRVETLLHENAHRFRNDLQRLGATVGLQILTAKDPAAKAALQEVQGRINALNAIKARLDVALRPDDGRTFVEAQRFLCGLVEDWSNTIAVQPIAFRADVEACLLPATHAVLLGLILNELMTNAVKYAFPDERAGTVWVNFHREDGRYVLRVADDGVGFDPQGDPKGAGLGGRIVRGLAGQLGGRLEVSARPGGGTLFSMTAPVTGPA